MIIKLGLAVCALLLMALPATAACAVLFNNELSVALDIIILRTDRTTVVTADFQQMIPAQAITPVPLVLNDCRRELYVQFRPRKDNAPVYGMQRMYKINNNGEPYFTISLSDAVSFNVISRRGPLF